MTMMKINAVMLLILLAVVGCAEKSTPILVPDKEEETRELALQPDEPQYKPMSNDAIIQETHKCESSGLDAEGLKMEKKYGSLIILIQCIPRTKT